MKMTTRELFAIWITESQRKAAPADHKDHAQADPEGETPAAAAPSKGMPEVDTERLTGSPANDIFAAWAKSMFD